MDNTLLALMAGAGIGWVIRDCLGRLKMDPKGITTALKQAADWVEETKESHQLAIQSLTEAHQQQLITHVSWSNQMLQAVIAGKGQVPQPPPQEHPEQEAASSPALEGAKMRREASSENYIKQLLNAGFSRADAVAILNGQDVDEPLDLVDKELDRATVRATKVT